MTSEAQRIGRGVAAMLPKRGGAAAAEAHMVPEGVVTARVAFLRGTAPTATPTRAKRLRAQGNAKLALEEP